ncbi:glycosyltransferase family 8 protein [Pholiota molesta]|nr:glycosyltransferase family 8 protein [Pholiota molesta]
MAYAFVSLVSSDAYLPGALAQVAALRDLHPSPPVPPELPFATVCLVTPESVDVATIRRLRHAFDHVIGVEILEQPNNAGLKLLGRPDLTTVLTKLHVFRLTQYDKIVFLDADVLPIRPISHLFGLPSEFSAAPDVGWPDIFNSGVLVLTPGEDKFDQLNQLIQSKPSWDGGDQGILNEWRGGDWNRLSFTYNTTPTAAYTYAPAYERYGSQIKAIHFIGPNKPWNSIPYRTPNSRRQPDPSDSFQRAYDYDSLVDRWFDVYDRHYNNIAQDVVPKTPFVPDRYVAVWDQPAESKQPAPPSVGALDLDELKRLALQGLTTSTTDSRPGEGTYQSLPLQGRVDLMRPRKEPEPTKPPPPPVEKQRQEFATDSDYFPSESFNYEEALSTPLARRAVLGESRWHTLPTPGPNEVPSSPRLRRISLPSTPSALPLFPTPAPDFYASESERESESLLLFRTDHDHVRRHDYDHHEPSPKHEPELHHGGQQQQQQQLYQHHYSLQQHQHHQHQLLQDSTQQHQTEAQPQQEYRQPERPHSPPMMHWNPAIEPPPNVTPTSNAFPTDTYFSNVWDHTPSRQNDHTQGPSPPDSSGFFQPPPPSVIPEPLLKQGHYRNVTGESPLGATPSPDRTKIKPVFPWENKPRVMPGRVFPDSDAPPPSLFLSPSSQSQTSTTTPSTPETRGPQARGAQLLSPLSGVPGTFNYTNAWDHIPSIQKYASRLVKPPSAPPLPLVPPGVLAPAFEDDAYRKRGKKSWDERTEMSSRDGDDEDNADDEDDDGPVAPSATKWDDDDSDGESAKRRSRRGSVVTADTLLKGSRKKEKEYKSRGVQTAVVEKRSMGVQAELLPVPRADSLKHSKRGSMSARRHWSPTTAATTIATTTRDINVGEALSVNTRPPPPQPNAKSPSASPTTRSPMRSPREFIAAGPRTTHKGVSPPLVRKPGPRAARASSASSSSAQEHLRALSPSAATPNATSPGPLLPSVLLGESSVSAAAGPAVVAPPLHPAPAPAPMMRRSSSSLARSSAASVARKPSNDSSLGSPASSFGPLSPADGHALLLASPVRKGTRVWDPARGVTCSSVVRRRCLRAF